MITKAFIPAAGLGTRLGNLTLNKPKALVEVSGRPMLELTIQRLQKAGIRHFLLNVHHFSEQVIAFATKQNKFGADITISDESAQLLDTGGAIKKAATFFDGNSPVLVHNVDVLSETDFSHLEQFHLTNEALVSLCVRDRDSSRKLLFDKEMKLVGWKHMITGTTKWVSEPARDYTEYAFSGIYLSSGGFAEAIPLAGKFSIIDAWLLMAGKHLIKGYLDTSPNWFDLGTPVKIQQAEAYMRKKNLPGVD